MLDRFGNVSIFEYLLHASHLSRIGSYHIHPLKNLRDLCVKFWQAVRSKLGLNDLAGQFI
jgi:hypothetical protein